VLHGFATPRQRQLYRTYSWGRLLDVFAIQTLGGCRLGAPAERGQWLPTRCPKELYSRSKPHRARPSSMPVKFVSIPTPMPRPALQSYLPSSKEPSCLMPDRAAYTLDPALPQHGVMPQCCFRAPLVITSRSSYLLPPSHTLSAYFCWSLRHLVRAYMFYSVLVNGIWYITVRRCPCELVR
jgi:hypothetical protein